MKPLDISRNERQLPLALMLYFATLFAARPLAGLLDTLPLHSLLAVLPALPMLWVIALMWQRVRASDELEQRVHLVALGAAAALVGAASLIAGFLVIGGVLRIGGDALIWIFPALLAGYGIAQNIVGRLYGMQGSCGTAHSPWVERCFALTSLGMLAVAIAALRKAAHTDAAILAITAILFAALAIRARRQRQRGDLDEGGEQS